MQKVVEATEKYALSKGAERVEAKHLYEASKDLLKSKDISMLNALERSLREEDLL